MKYRQNVKDTVSYACIKKGCSLFRFKCTQSPIEMGKDLILQKM